MLCGIKTSRGNSISRPVEVRTRRVLEIREMVKSGVNLREGMQGEPMKVIIIILW